MPQRSTAPPGARVVTPTALRPKVDNFRNKKTKTRLDKNATVNFGVHLMIDGYGGDKAKLGNMDLVFTVLDALPDNLGMHKITTPYVVRADANDKKDPGGYSGFVMIAESHISVHTFPDKGFASIDVYTCQTALATKRICNYFKENFGFIDLEVRETKRGLRFPKYVLN